MGKRGIWNEQTYRGRNKGNTDTHIPNEHTREHHEEMKWDSPQFCETCWNKPCICKNDEHLTGCVDEEYYNG